MQLTYLHHIQTTFIADSKYIQIVPLFISEYSPVCSFVSFLYCMYFYSKCLNVLNVMNWDKYHNDTEMYSLHFVAHFDYEQLVCRLISAMNIFASYSNYIHNRFQHIQIISLFISQYSPVCSFVFFLYCKYFHSKC